MLQTHSCGCFDAPWSPPALLQHLITLADVSAHLPPSPHLSCLCRQLQTCFRQHEHAGIPKLDKFTRQNYDGVSLNLVQNPLLPLNPHEKNKTGHVLLPLPWLPRSRRNAKGKELKSSKENRRASWAALGKGLGSFQAGSFSLCLGSAWIRS